jgi:hypothetical protein
MRIFSQLSTEFTRIAISATASGVDVDPTADLVEMAFVPQGTVPAAGDWKTGSWEQDVSTTPTTHLARVLVGPGTGGVVTLTPGLFDAYVRIHDSTELPVIKAGPVRVI